MTFGTDSSDLKVWFRTKVLYRKLISIPAYLNSICIPLYWTVGCNQGKVDDEQLAPECWLPQWTMYQIAEIAPRTLLVTTTTGPLDIYLLLCVFQCDASFHFYMLTMLTVRNPIINHQAFYKILLKRYVLNISRIQNKLHGV